MRTWFRRTKSGRGRSGSEGEEVVDIDTLNGDEVALMMSEVLWVLPSFFHTLIRLCFPLSTSIV
jgi:hypothetical protein